MGNSVSGAVADWWCYLHSQSLVPLGQYDLWRFSSVLIPNRSLPVSMVALLRNAESPSTIFECATKRSWELASTAVLRHERPSSSWETENRIAIVFLRLKRKKTS